MGDRVFLHLRPTGVGIPFTPGPPGLRIVRSLCCEIVERAAIILQIEHAISRLEIEIRSVQLIAMPQARSEVSLPQLGLPDLCLYVIESFGLLSLQRGQSNQDKQDRPQTCTRHIRLRREDLLMTNSIPSGEYTSQQLRGIHHAFEAAFQGL